MVRLYAALLALLLVLPWHCNGQSLSSGLGAVSLTADGAEMVKEVSEQDRLDTIVRAFKRLPPPELERLGVDVSSDRILQGTERAEQLKRAWLERQAELKRAFESMTKPAEHMGELARRIKEYHDGVSSASLSIDPEDLLVNQTSAALDELESALADIDNARDFHTIKGWPVLVSILAPIHRSELRARAALAVGTAVKNSYDYQLWVLEPSPIPSTISSGSESTKQLTVLELLLVMLAHPTDAELQRKALYAISAAARGNTDVQERLLELATTASASGQPAASMNIMHYLHALAANNSTAPELGRKVWSLVSDMLQEAAYVRGELSSSMAAAAGGAQDQIQAQIQALQMLKMLGDALCSPNWAQLASQTLRRLGLGQNAALETSAATRATLLSALRAAGDMLELCPDKLQGQGQSQGLVQGQWQGQGGADLSAVLSALARQLHDRFVAWGTEHHHHHQQQQQQVEQVQEPPRPALLEEGGTEMESGDEIDQFDLHDQLDEKLVGTFADEVLQLAAIIVAKYPSADAPRPAILL